MRTNEKTLANAIKRNERLRKAIIDSFGRNDVATRLIYPTGCCRKCPYHQRNPQTSAERVVFDLGESREVVLRYPGRIRPTEDNKKRRRDR